MTTQFPDFGVVTADDYLDLIEIKLPKTPLLSFDSSHNSYYWSSHLAKAIAQVESYIQSVTTSSDAIIVAIGKLSGIQLKIAKPRGIVIAGNSAQFDGEPRKADFFRMLSEGLKNVEVIPYDELARRLRNTRVSIEALEKKAGIPRKRRKKTAKKKTRKN